MSYKENDLHIARDSDLWDKAVETLRSEFEEHGTDGEILALYEEKGNEWWHGYHFFWGMATRNFLRDEGFGEENFGIVNLDNIYIELVHEAVGINPQE